MRQKFNEIQWQIYTKECRKNSINGMHQVSSGEKKQQQQQPFNTKVVVAMERIQWKSETSLLPPTWHIHNSYKHSTVHMPFIAVMSTCTHVRVLYIPLC